ncbi:MAG TPA: hypothetical protein VHV53_06135 [Solirubrobacterales bacterium]|jgi:hypothetical protein|nr:hypothetical protein [Solirubrobacterales bacterium]
MAPNPEAVAWYVKRSEDLLDDHRERIRSLRSRGGQLAGFSGAVLALAGANAEPILDALRGLARDCAGASLLVGALLLIVALVTALRGTLVPRLVSDLSAEEVANYTSNRFLSEPDLWRVQVRALRGLLDSIEWTTRQGDEAAQAVSGAENLFFAGLTAVGQPWLSSSWR